MVKLLLSPPGDRSPFTQMALETTESTLVIEEMDLLNKSSTNMYFHGKKQFLKNDILILFFRFFEMFSS